MIRTLLKSKIHRATVTDADLEYDGSLTLDTALMDAAELMPYEQIDIYNITRGARLTTYVIEGERASGEVCVNGAAAHLVKPGDLIIIAAYAAFDEQEARRHRPRVVLVDASNRPRPVSRET